MPRKPRPDYTHTYHHIVVRGVDGLYIFDSDKKKSQYVEIMKDAHQSHDISIFAVGFQDNHVHQFVRRNNDEMGRYYRRVNGRYSQWYNQNFDRTGTLYDSRYFSVLIDSDAYFSCIWRYVHNQRVQSGQYESPENDPWSSAGTYLGRNERFSWIDWEEGIEELGVEYSENELINNVFQSEGEET
ncbi:MAG: transposase, partial [bacterium]